MRVFFSKKESIDTIAGDPKITIYIGNNMIK
jgi:hypothetical protein